MRPRELTIDGIRIADDTDCYVIAEIGHNHQGSVEQAKQLFEEARRCGASAVKLQKRDNRSLYTADFFNKPYENENSFGPTYGLHREALEFDRDEYLELKTFATQLGIGLVQRCALLPRRVVQLLDFSKAFLVHGPLLRLRVSLISLGYRGREATPRRISSISSEANGRSCIIFGNRDGRGNARGSATGDQGLASTRP